MKLHEAGSGDPVIFIHGFPFNASQWAPQLEAVPEGWRFMAPDLRGFGESPLPEGPLDMDTFADDIVGMMDDFELEQAVICGLSMGGYVALSIADRYPRRVRALVLVATRANADTEPARKARDELAAHVRKEGMKPVVDSMLPKLVSAHSRLKYPDVVEKVRAMMEATAPETAARALEGMVARTDYTPKLDRISVSTMVIRGEQDEIIAAGDMERIARTVRGARHEMVALTAHLPNLEAPDVFNTILGQFLKQLPPPLKLGDLSLSF
jgi:pimeloyl-ACP methyl ester carboxylesterase